MSKGNPVHAEVGRIFSEEVKKYPGCEPLVDKACRGKQYIPLFYALPKSRATEYCNVDLIAIKDGAIKMIVEIEESNIKPTQVCGKFLTSALSRYYIHGSKTAEMADSVTFLQIVDISKLKGKTSKLKQFEALEQSINSILPLKDSKITKYRLLTTDQLPEIKGLIQEALNPINMS